MPLIRIELRKGKDATYIDEPVVTDGKIVTARAPIDLPAFVHEIDHLLAAA